MFKKTILSALVLATIATPLALTLAPLTRKSITAGPGMIIAAGEATV